MRTVVSIALCIFFALACTKNAGDTCQSDEQCGDGLRCASGVCGSIYGNADCETRCRRFNTLKGAVRPDGSKHSKGGRPDEQACLERCRRAEHR